MDEGRKWAYRRLLYLAMLEIRELCPPYNPITWNPRKVWQGYRRGQRAGAIADWLHNLAIYSQHDFDGFEEDWFWREHERLQQCFPDGWPRYKQEFQDELKRWEETANK